MGRAQTHAHATCMDATTGEADPRLRQGSGRLIAAVVEAEAAAEAAVTVAAAAADGFIDWHCRHRPKESVSGVRELYADGASRFSWSWKSFCNEKSAPNVLHMRENEHWTDNDHDDDDDDDDEDDEDDDDEKDAYAYSADSFRPHPGSIFDRDERPIDILVQAWSVETTYNFEITIILEEKSLISFANYGNAKSQLRYFASEEQIAKRFAASRRKVSKAPLSAQDITVPRRSHASLDVNSFPLLQLNMRKRGQKTMRGRRK
ncbi:PREDICTED: uncharacterized protein LOC105146975 [Acromyrmex echinatior]|uniref:uncharacterized protein LOC105146975 n=1 Tax=Acromyrmex echinatior TaxID=103372 RepID=UPI000580EBF3|nr:PREDICTED: uncharacterized protein LOC105146975 [Acromyrmex echinatior]